jgi:hypothetical protein
VENKLKDVFSNVKDRLSNPLIFSFIISWLIYNWEITVALLWYDKFQIQAEGCKSIFEFIQNKLDNKFWSTILPLIVALIYTLGFPYLKGLINILNKIALNFTKKNEMKYVKEVTIEKIKQLEKELEEVKNQNFQDKNFINQLYNFQVIEGYWQCKIKLDN